MGFDNMGFSVVVHPPLTTIHQPKYEMGSAAVDILLRLAHDKGKQMPEHRRLGVELIERQSCKQPLADPLRALRRAGLQLVPMKDSYSPEREAQPSDGRLARPGRALAAWAERWVP